MFKIKRFFKQLKRSISWAIFMWNNEDWDSGYLFDVMEKKLLEIKKEILNGYNGHKKRDALLIDIAIHNLKQSSLEWDDVSENLCTLHRKKFGETENECIEEFINGMKCYRMVLDDYSKCKTSIERKYADKVLHRILDISEMRNERYWNKFNYIFKKYVRNWWD